MGICFEIGCAIYLDIHPRSSVRRYDAAAAHHIIFSSISASLYDNEFTILH